MNSAKRMKWIPAAAMVLLLMGSMAPAQTDDSAKTAPAASQAMATQTFYLTNVITDKDQNDILTALRNLSTVNTRMVLVPTPGAIIVSGTPEAIQLARKIINDLDRPRKVYRLTYTVTDIEGGNHVGAIEAGGSRVGTQHFSMVATAGQKVSVKQGNKVPYSTGPQQYQYADIGMNFEATVNETEKGVKLQTKVEQSSVAEKSDLPSQPPTFRQSTFEGTSYLTLGKPQLLGSLDIPGTTRHLDIDVMVEPVQ